MPRGRRSWEVPDGDARHSPAQGAAGELLRAARQRAGISQKELAVRAATKQSAVSRIERGRVSPTVDTLERILAAAGCALVLTLRTEGDQHGPDE
jgi:transcriptional regulator with XRE-family HTH domain